MVKVLNFLSVALFIFSIVFMFLTCGSLDADRVTIAGALLRMVIGFTLAGISAIIQMVAYYIKQNQLKEDN